MPGEEERRRHPRMFCGDRLSVQLLAASDEPTPQGKTMASDARDVSAGGLCLRVDRQLPVGSSLDLWIRVAGRSGTFLLRGKVKWVNENADGDYLMGIEFLEKPSGDTGEWLSMIEGELQDRER